MTKITNKKRSLRQGGSTILSISEGQRSTSFAER